MRELPILYSTPMVQAKLDERKTETRRIIKPQPSDSWMEGTKQFSPNGSMYDYKGKQLFWLSDGGYNADDGEIRCPFGKPGDVLYGRETWAIEHFRDHDSDQEEWACVYKADDPERTDIKWKPSIHMAKADARIWERVVEVRVERLHDITEAGAIAEGAQHFKDLPPGPIDQGFQVSGSCRWSMEDPPNTDFCLATARFAFANYIDQIHDGAWSLNPWVWVIRTEILSTTGRPENL